MRAGASRVISSAIFGLTIPAPAFSVSSTCAAGESSSSIAAAMPPRASTEEAPSPSGEAVTTVTGRGASFSAQNRPASPPPTMTTSSTPPHDCGGSSSRSRGASDIALLPRRDGSALQMDHPLDGAAGARGGCRIDFHLLAKIHEAVENLRQRDALHLVAGIGGTHEFDAWRFRLPVIGHRALGDHHHLLRPLVLDEVDHRRGRAGEVGLRDHVGRALGMGKDLHARIAFAIAPQLLGSETLVHFAVALPGDD